jgi:hypothetical protein
VLSGFNIRPPSRPDSPRQVFPSLFPFRAICKVPGSPKSVALIFSCLEELTYMRENCGKLRTKIFRKVPGMHSLGCHPGHKVGRLESIIFLGSPSYLLRRRLYGLSHSVHLSLGWDYFRDRVSQTICLELASNCHPPDLCLLSS